VPADGTKTANWTKYKAETSVRRRFLGSASDKLLLAPTYQDGMPKVNNKDSSKEKICACHRSNAVVVVAKVLQSTKFEFVLNLPRGSGAPAVTTRSHREPCRDNGWSVSMTLASAAKPSPLTRPASMQARTMASNTSHKISLSRKRPWRLMATI